MQKPLTPAERQALKGRAHGLNAVVLVGGEGLTAGVLGEIDRALAAHELIKIRVLGHDRGDREALLAAVCAATGAAPVQHIGKVLVVFREQPEEAATPATRPTGRARAPSATAAAKRPARAPRRGLPRRAKIRSR